MQHYIDVCAEKDVSCIFEILRALELLELRPQQPNHHNRRASLSSSNHLQLPPQLGYRSGWRFAERSGSPGNEEDEAGRPYVSLELAPVMGPLALMEKTHRPGRIYNPSDDPSMKLQLDTVDVECLTEALRRCNRDADITLHRPLLHVLVAGAETELMARTGAWVGLIAEWRKHIVAVVTHRDAPRSFPPSVLAARGCGGGLRFLVGLVEEAMTGPVSIDITSALRGGAGRHRSVSPFSTANDDASTSGSADRSNGAAQTDTGRLVQWALDVSCNTFGPASEHQQRTVTVDALTGTLDALKVLWRHHQLRHLSLAYCDLSAPNIHEAGSASAPSTLDADVTMFFEDACTTLLTLSVRGCPSAFGVAGNSWVRSCAVKASLWSLVRLDVSKMELTDETAVVLADAVKRSSSLMVLMARHNHFTQVGFAAFAESLVHPSCCLQELFLGMQTPPPPPSAPMAKRGSSPLKRGSSPTGVSSPSTTEPVAGGPQFLHIRGATPSLYGDGKKAQRPPTELETVSDDAAGAGSYHAAATNILVALGGNKSIRVCDLTGLPFDEPPTGATSHAAPHSDVEGGGPAAPPPFIILSALSDMILNTNSLRILCLTFPSTLQTPMRKELRRASTTTASAQQYPIGGGTGAPSRPSLAFPAKALFDHPSASTRGQPSSGHTTNHYAVPTQSSQARVSTGGPLDAFVQPPMRFTSSSGTAAPAAQATSGTQQALHHHHQTSKLDRFVGPTHSGTSSISSSVGSTFHLSSGLEFEEFLVAVNTQRELRGLYAIGVRNGCPQEAAALELFVQHPLDMSGFVSPPAALEPKAQPINTVYLMGSSVTSVAPAHNPPPPPPTSAPAARRASPQASLTERPRQATPVPTHRPRSVDSSRTRRPSPHVAPFRSTNTTGAANPVSLPAAPAASARRPVVSTSGGLQTPRGATPRWGGTSLTSAPAPAAPGVAAPAPDPAVAPSQALTQSFKTLTIHVEAVLQHIVASWGSILSQSNDAKLQLMVSSYSLVHGRIMHDALERVDAKWSGLRDREILLRQEMLRATEERMTLEQRQRELDRTEGEIRYRFKQLEDEQLQLQQTPLQAQPTRQGLQPLVPTAHDAPSPAAQVTTALPADVVTPVFHRADDAINATVMTNLHTVMGDASPAPKPPTQHYHDQHHHKTDCRSDSTGSVPMDGSIADPPAHNVVLHANAHNRQSAQVRTPQGKPPLVAPSSGETMEKLATHNHGSNRGSLATSPMEAPIPAVLHVSPHPLQTPHHTLSDATSSTPSLLRSISTMKFHTVCAAYSRFQAAMSALSVEERSAVEAMWSAGRSAVLEGPGAAIHPQRLALVSFIAGCDEQYLFGESPRRSGEHAPTISQEADIALTPAVYHQDVSTSSAHATKPPIAARPLDTSSRSSAAKSQNASPPSQSLGATASSVSRHLQLGSAARPSDESPKRRPSTDSQSHSVRQGSRGGSILKTSAPLNPPPSPMARGHKKGIVSPTHQQRGARVVVLPATHATTTPPRINSLSLRRKSEVLRRHDEELALAHGRHEQDRSSSLNALITGPTTQHPTEVGSLNSPRKGRQLSQQHNTPPTPRHLPGHHSMEVLELTHSDRLSSEGRHHRRSHPRTSARGASLSSPPNPSRGKARRHNGLDDMDDHPTESVQFDMEDDRTSSLDFEEYDVRSDVDDEDYAVIHEGAPANEDANHQQPPAHAHALNPLLLRSRLTDDDGHDKESIKFDEGTMEASPDFFTDDVYKFKTASSYVHKRGSGGNTGDGDSVGSSVNFDEEHAHHDPSPSFGSAPAPSAAPRTTVHADGAPPPQVDLYASLRKDLAQKAARATTPPSTRQQQHARLSSSDATYVEGTLLSSPTSLKVRDRLDPKLLKDATAIAREREFVRVKIMPLSVSELRSKYPQVRTMLESMTLEEYEAFMDAWSCKYRHGHAKALADLQELMLRCALCGMFR